MRVLHSVLGTWQRLGAKVQLSLMQARACPCMMGCHVAPSSQVAVRTGVVTLTLELPVLLACFGSIACYGLLQHFSCCIYIQDCVFNSVELVRKR